MKSFRYLMPTEVVFGPKSLMELRAKSAHLGSKPFVVTGRNSARVSGALDHVLKQFPDSVIFSDVEENPATDICDQAAAQCRKSGRDFVVAIGGGSPMDVGKAVAGLIANPGPCRELFGTDTLRNGALPIAAVPTTAGTGSEVTPYSVLVDAESRTKRSIADRALFPAVAILDPELTRTMPPSVTASTGLDALSQAMEGFVSRKSTPIGDALALEACRIIRRRLPSAVADGNDLEARADMMYAAMLSGCVIAQSGTTLVHGMGYAYTTRSRVPHGLANALLLAPVFRFNAIHAPEKVAALAGALGYPASPQPSEAGSAITRAVYELLRECGASPAAKDAGVNSDLLPAFADEVASEPYRFRNQLGEITRDQVLAFYEASYEGISPPAH